MKTILGLYEDMNAASQTVTELVDAGIARENIRLATSPQVAHEIEQTVGIGTKYNPAIDAEHSKANGVKTGAVIGGVSGVLIGLGAIAIPGIGAVLGGLIGAGVGAAIGTGKEVDVSEEEAGYYAEGVRRGGILLSTKVADDQANDVIALMKRHHPVDVHDRAKQWRKEGWTGYTPLPDETAYVASLGVTSTGQPFESQSAFVGHTHPATGNGNYYADKAKAQDLYGETKIPVVEEELLVGKHEVDSGSVRVDRWVETQPVAQQVNLREEKVTVERQPVNRLANASDLNAFEAGSFEVTATSEEAVVEKRPRVVEEVTVKKAAQNHTKTISDTVRKTKVDVTPATPDSR